MGFNAVDVIDGAMWTRKRMEEAREEEVHACVCVCVCVCVRACVRVYELDKLSL